MQARLQRASHGRLGRIDPGVGFAQLRHPAGGAEGERVCRAESTIFAPQPVGVGQRGVRLHDAVSCIENKIKTVYFEKKRKSKTPSRGENR